MNRTAAPVGKLLVLVGGGHSHVAVLKTFAMRPQPGVGITLVSRGSVTPYSGMLPGLIAGHYNFDQAHIELRPLARLAGADFVHAEATGLDLENRRVLFGDRPPLAFDVLSLDIGSTPNTRSIPGATEHAIPVKPIDRFLARWDELIARASPPRNKPFRVLVVGGGAGGVELLLAARKRLCDPKSNAGGTTPVEFRLVTASATILPGHNRSVQRRFARILREQGVMVDAAQRVVEVGPREVRCADGRRLEFDALLWTTQAAPPSWFREAGLATDEHGFLAVNDCLQSVSHPVVFAAGDCAAVLAHPRPKSGVFAVRQGMPLAENLRRALQGEALAPFTPQREFLSLISTGGRYAVASRGPWAAEGAWIWRWKDWIDRRWMRQYQNLPALGAVPMANAETPGTAPISGKPDDEPRCGGCAAKVASDALHRALRRLPPSRRDDVVLGLEAPDDAAAIKVPPGRLNVQTVDFFRAFLNDPFLFGKIATHHALNDIFAMGAEPSCALAIAVLPHSAERVMEEQLFQLLAGAVEVLHAHGAALAGGHSSEGAELEFGLAVTGLADPARLLRKSGMKPGDRLILTKPLGTGALFAGEMRGRARGRWIESVLASMLHSNAAAARCLLAHDATACTDVSGFGIAGHLAEMARASNARIGLDWKKLRWFNGAREMVCRGIVSSLHPQNVRVSGEIQFTDAQAAAPEFQLLFDPQTSGGLLASVPAARAAAAVAALHEAGCEEAIDIGSVEAPGDGEKRIRLRD